MSDKLTKQKDETPAVPANAFAMLLQEQRGGSCLQEASDKLNELIRAMKERLKPCEITVKFKFQPAAGASIVTITDEITVKQPKEDKEATIMFTTEDGTLTRTNPDQRELALRQVEKVEQPLREVEQEDRPMRKTAG